MSYYAVRMFCWTALTIAYWFHGKSYVPAETYERALEYLKKLPGE